MTDPMDDLRQASADVSGVEVLSHAAQTIMDAYMDEYLAGRLAVAAVLRAVANYCPRERRILMTIADELEAQQ